MTNTSKNDKAAQLTTCETGVTNNVPASQSWVFVGKTYKRGDFLNMLQACIDASKQTKADHDVWRASVDAEKAAYALLRPVLGAFKKSLESEYGAGSLKLAEYGFVPAKPHVVPAVSKATSVTKARATRGAKKAAVAAAVKALSPVAPAAPVEPAAPATPPAVPAATAPVPANAKGS
jgi:hypothetical protein